MFKINVDDKEVLLEFDTLEKRLQDMSPAMASVASYLHEVTDDAFMDQRSPFGEPWAPLKSGRQGQILIDTARMVSSIDHSSGVDYAELSVGAVQAAIHQFGGQTKPHTIVPRDKKALAFG